MFSLKAIIEEAYQIKRKQILLERVKMHVDSIKLFNQTDEHTVMKSDDFKKLQRLLRD